MIIWRMINAECKGHLELSGANFLTIIWYLIEWLFEEWLMKNGSVEAKLGYYYKEDKYYYIIF